MITRIDISTAHFPKVTDGKLEEFACSMFITYRLAIADNQGRDLKQASDAAADMWREFGVEHRGAWVAAARDMYENLALLGGARFDSVHANGPSPKKGK